MVDKGQTAQPDNMLVQRYAAEFSIPRELAQVIALRFPVYTEARAYLFPDPKSLHDPGLLPDIDQAADTILGALRDNIGILVYCHDDVDGYTAGVVMHETLRDLMRNPEQKLFLYPVIREQDGYILNPKVLNEFRSQGAGLIVTVDFGVSSTENFEVAKELGMGLVVCDHHEVKSDAFSAPAVDPKRPSSHYPFRDLAGVGVTFKLAQFLYQRSLGLDAGEFYSIKKEFFPLVMLGTIADRVMLQGENRVLSRYGMEMCSQVDVPWVRYFREQGDIDGSVITGMIIPTIASATYYDPAYGVKVFMSKDMAFVRDTFRKLMNVTDERRQGVAAFFQDVISAANVLPDIVISVIPFVRQHYLGSVAGWLRDRYRRTAVVIGTRDRRCIGELRSHHLDLYEMLYSMKDLFFDYGGHQKAAGFTMDHTHLDELIALVQRYAADRTHPEENKTDEPVFYLQRSHIDMLKPMMPFGEGNPAPILTDGSHIYTIDNKMNIIEKGAVDG
jgi:single-stranded-DNA-specific exonuclease